MINTLYQIEPEGWVQIGRTGSFTHAKGLNVFTQGDLAACASGFGAELLVDFEHESRTPEGSTEAAGWVQAVQCRADGSLWAQVRWSDAGRAAVEGGRYRFCSPEFMSHQEADGWHPRQLAGLALTNRPNLKGLTPLSHRETNPTQTMNKIALALGLAETATEDQIIAAITALTSEKDDVLANRLLAEFGLEGDAEAKVLILAHRDAALPLLKMLGEARKELAAVKAAAPERLLHKAVPPVGEAPAPTLQEQYAALPVGPERRAFFKANQAALWGDKA